MLSGVRPLELRRQVSLDCQADTRRRRRANVSPLRFPCAESWAERSIRGRTATAQRAADRARHKPCIAGRRAQEPEMLLQKLMTFHASAQVPVEEWRAALWTQALAEQVPLPLLNVCLYFLTSGWSPAIICPMSLLCYAGAKLSVNMQVIMRQQYMRASCARMCCCAFGLSCWVPHGQATSQHGLSGRACLQVRP